MTAPAVRKKWRPSLSMIVFAVLLAAMLMPLASLFLFRLYENQVIRQTESELIAQSAALAAVFSQDVRDKLSSGITLGAVRPPEARPSTNEPYQPIVAMLDLAGDDLRERRPGSVVATDAADPEFVEIGRRLFTLTQATQRITLAGFRILDPAGIVIAGRDEVGRSLAHIHEVRVALTGRYSSVLRTRVSNRPPPPLYSVSRGTGVRVFVAFPVIVDERVAGVIYTSRTPNNILKHLFLERRKVVFAALSVVVITLLIGFLFLRVITQPIKGLIRYTDDVGRGLRETASLPIHQGSREIALLSQSFADMTAQLSARADYISTFASHVSHEMKSPLTAMHGAAELLRDSSTTMTEEDRAKFLDNIINDTQRLTALLNRLRELAYADNPNLSGSTTLEAVIAGVQRTFPALTVSLSGNAGLPIAMSLDNALMVFTHLADNASRHHAKAMSTRLTAGDDEICVHVANDGDSISPGNQDKIFEPFFTTRRDAGGTGMGLGIVQSILKAHGGSIRLAPTQTGAAFEIRLPGRSRAADLPSS